MRQPSTNFTATNRRDFLKQSALLGAGLSFGLSLEAAALESRKIASETHRYPFFGTHQQGIATPAQKHLYFMVLDLHSTDPAQIKAMFQTWTAYSANLTAGKNVQPYGNNAYLPPIDTGEADSLNPQNLTLTFGVSPHFFEKLGITSLKPKALTTLPHFPRDQLREPYTQGDICIQACADDPQVAFHAVRNLVRVARGQITMRWSQSGFNAFDQQDTPRNLFGFKDGTANPQGAALDKTVWCSDEDWLKNGSYLVARRIQMHLETWDRTNLNGQQETFGRYRDSGAPLGAKAEFDPVDIEKTDEKGNLVIPDVAHIHLAKKTGQQMLRRSFSYASGVDPKTGQFDAGLMFISFQKDPEQFIAIQNSLGNIDRMNEYITHIGSGLFACFAGVKDENDYLGSTLFAQI